MRKEDKNKYQTYVEELLPLYSDPNIKEKEKSINHKMHGGRCFKTFVGDEKINLKNSFTPS